MKPQPLQPEETDWHFVQELQSTLWTQHHWKPRAAKEDEATLAEGVSVIANFPDTDNLLETAYADLQDFMNAGGVLATFNSRSLSGAEANDTSAPLSERDKSTFIIETTKIETSIPEEYRITITAEKVLIAAADTEGIRRGIFHLEEEMLRRGGPFLPLGELSRKPVIRTRISRCFFGPINRPPKNRDELVDDVDYYPEQYLNRLAHHGVNGLWMTIKFSDLCPSRFFPDHGKDWERRLEKFRQIVAKCKRYGIKIYAFYIEPRGFGGISEYMSSPATLEQFPNLGGHKNGPYTYFCTSSSEGQEYVESCAAHLFTNVPELGGMIGINLGERPTHCYSDSRFLHDNNCPRCSKRAPGEVFAEMLGALRRGMDKGNPDAELVSWLYVPYLGHVSEEAEIATKAEMAKIAALMPSRVIVQVNFESYGVANQWDRDHYILDYSLAYVGPSEVFASCARAAKNARVSAKLQVGNSHEVATVPFVPVPGNLYRKYQKMRELGVSSAMQCWFFGNYPSPMTEAAGRLSFDPLPETEEEFLQQLASPHWGEDAEIVAQAWQYFRKAYEQFPAALQFSWFGPVHDCVNWPLYLKPVDEIIQPSWLLKSDVSGDRVAECFAFEFSRPEIIETCRRMDEEWAKGLALLKNLNRDVRELQTEIGVAQALGLQIHSAWNVMRFYELRDELPYVSPDQQLANLETMRQIVQDEIANSKQLSQLAENDSRLGFHSEAEGYKYFPAKLAWRVDQLEALLAEDFPEVQQQIETEKVLFPEFTGVNPQGAVYYAKWQKDNSQIDWKVLSSEPCTVSDSTDLESYQTTWQCTADDKNLYIKVNCKTSKPSDGEQVTLAVEPRRCWPAQKFILNKNGKIFHENCSPMQDHRWNVNTQITPDGWEAELEISWDIFRDSYTAPRPIRVNVSRQIPEIGTIAWQKHEPLPPRLVFGENNSADYGWVIFE